MSGILVLLLARARRRPGRWALPALGVALAVAFAIGVVAEGTVAGTRAARSTLAGLTPLERTVRITWEGPVTAATTHQTLGALASLGLSPPGTVTLLNGVRLGGRVVRLAAIAPLARWSSPARVGPCRRDTCPVLVAGGALALRRLGAPGVTLAVRGRTRLASAAPLGFVPEPGDGAPPLLLSADVGGVDRLAGLSGVYRTHSWFSLLPVAGRSSWQLAPLERRLQAVQNRLLAASSQFGFSAPFAALDAARAQAAIAPRRLLVAGGGAISTLVLFLVLAAGGLRRDQADELERLRALGARAHQCLLFLTAEAGWVCGLAALAGTGLGLLATALLAGAEGIPVAGVLGHAVLTPAVVGGLVAGWLLGTVMLTLLLLAPGTERVGDVLAISALAALGLALLIGGGDSGPLALALAPLACLACGVLVYRLGGLLMRGGERLAREGPVRLRLALVGLARAPGPASLAIAFLAVSTGLGGFALAYRATLLRGSADQAAAQVPLDALVSPSPAFATPLELAPLARWRALSGGAVLPVLRTQATYVSGGASVTVAVLGVPAAGLRLIGGWRAGELPTSRTELARRLRPPGPVRRPGPRLAPGTRRLALVLTSPVVAVSVTAELRDASGTIRPLALGAGFGRRVTLSAPVPPGAWELEALELDEPTGLQVTNEHQNGENAGAATQASSTLVLGPLRSEGASGRVLATASLAGWRALGSAAQAGGAARAGSLEVRFAQSGLTGIVRPPQPSDTEPLPVLADPATALAAGGGRRLALSVDGQPVTARIVGVLRRFPTVPSGGAGFVVADRSRLGAALEAQLPGQDRSNELWIATPSPGRLRAALSQGPLASLAVAYRADLQRALASAPLARAVLGTLLAAAALSAVLAVLGLLLAATGAIRERVVEDDLFAQGVGPGALRGDLRLRLWIAGAAGVAGGLAIALVLTHLSVGAVRAAGAVADPEPPLVAVTPATAVLLWALAAGGALAIVGWLASRAAGNGAAR